MLILVHPQVVKIVNEILALNMIESRELIKMLKKELNIPDGGMPMGMPMMGMPMGGGGGAPAGGGAAADAGAAAAAAPAAEKTEFDLKLASFNAADKVRLHPHCGCVRANSTTAATTTTITATVYTSTTATTATTTTITTDTLLIIIADSCAPNSIVDLKLTRLLAVAAQGHQGGEDHHWAGAQGE